MTDEARPPAPRGGRRPGAGAPRGNLNALASGAKSARLVAVRRQLPPGSRRLFDVAVRVAAARARQHAARGHIAAAVLAELELVITATADAWAARHPTFAARHHALTLALRPWLELADEDGNPRLDDDNEQSTPADSVSALEGTEGSNQTQQ